MSVWDDGIIRIVGMFNLAWFKSCYSNRYLEKYVIKYAIKNLLVYGYSEV